MLPILRGGNCGPPGHHVRPEDSSGYGTSRYPWRAITMKSPNPLHFTRRDVIEKLGAATARDAFQPSQKHRRTTLNLLPFSAVRLDKL